MLKVIKLLVLVVLLVSCQSSSFAAPRPQPLPQPQTDIDDYGGGLSVGGTGSNVGFDYNSMMSHFKDFVMYLPVMMTTLKETMTGFPKFAEGIRILTSKNGRLEGGDCNCMGAGSNEIDNGL